MNWGLTILLVIPLAGALLACLMPLKQIGQTAAITTLVQVGFVVPVLINHKIGVGMSGYVNETWIPDLGVHYALGLDGLNLFLVALTILAWTVGTFVASRREVDQPRMFYAMLALAEVGTLGAFMAQDLILFVLFFDLLLVPFYFLIGIWGSDRDGVTARRATATFMIYTLAGSLLMLVAAVAMGVLAALENNTPINFLFSNLAANPVSHTAQMWIFVGFLLAFLVKMPIPPLHGWMPVTYRATPLAVLIPLSAVVAKLATYGFLRIVLPLLPSAAHSFQPLLLLLAIIGIVYGSVMAFSQDDVRLVVGYSSVAQIGFVLLGIFVFDGKGAEGAVLQMVNHGIVVIGLMVLIGFLAERTGSEQLSKMGGLAKNAPLLATLFLILSLATLAMPGSANFVGETYILFGAFAQKFAWGAVASVGVVLAAMYMLRFFQKSMQNRESTHEGVVSRELDAGELALLLPAVLIVLALSVYPQYIVERIEPNAAKSLTAVKAQQIKDKVTAADLVKPGTEQ